MTDLQGVSAEQKAIIVQSSFSDTVFAIDRKGKGMWIVSGNSEIPVSSENVEVFARELVETWETFRRDRT